MLTFLALAHMLAATQDAGLGGGDVNVPCTCTLLDAAQDAGLGWGGGMLLLLLLSLVPVVHVVVVCRNSYWQIVSRVF